MHLAAPAAMALLASFAAGLLHRRLQPALAVPVLAGLCALSALSVLWVLVLLTLGFLSHVAWVAQVMSWCSAVNHAHHAVPPVVGAAASAALAGSVWSAKRYLRNNPLPARSTASGSELVVLPDAGPTAYAVPGDPGRIVVSVAMLRALDDEERRVLLAHERAHLRHRHHRYVHVGDLAAAAVPILAPIRSRLRFATERWADETAAEAVGDRVLTARAIARAALATSGAPATALAAADLGVPARVDALLGRPRSSGPTAVSWSLTAVVAVLLTAAASTVQLHHLGEFVAQICGT
jgi:Zn-dependent protease with chaperone function